MGCFFAADVVGGDTIGASADQIRYGLVVMVEAQKHLDLYDRILADHVKLKKLQAQVGLPFAFERSMGMSVRQHHRVRSQARLLLRYR